MSKYILKRILMMIPVMIGVSFIVFCMVYFTPGDPARYMLGADATPEAIETLHREMGLDKPFLAQYANYLINIVTKGDFGTSYTTRRSVTIEILERFPNTLRLTCMSMAFATIIGVTTGIISAVYQYSILDNIATVISITGVSMPNFWTGLMLIILFSLKLKLFPSSGFETPAQWVLPTIMIGFASSASIMRQTRSSMLEVIRQDYITTARAKGQTESGIIFKHALRNALISVITVIGISFGSQLGGAIIAESIFSIPGLGKLMIDSINMKNYPMVQGCVLFTALCFSIVNLLVDLIYTVVDPRLATQYAGSSRSKKKAAKQAEQ